MKKTLILLLTLLSWFSISAQVADSLNQEASPKGGINQLAIKYYGIDFTKDQKKKIENIEIEFIYSIDELGKPTLSEINGVNDLAILDSLRNKTAEIEAFNPWIEDGIPKASIYFMKLTYPTYKLTQKTYWGPQGPRFNNIKIEDFEHITESSQRFDILIGGLANQFIGNLSKHLALGGGMKTEFAYSGKNKLLYGLNMSFYGNKLKKDYPLNTTREQFDAPATLLIGLTFGKWFSKFNIQAELNFAVQNIIEKLSNSDPDWIQLKGWSPGLLFNYPVKLGKQKPTYYYGSPVLLENNINFHFGIRYIKLSIPEATGLMAEIGISYRMALKGIKDYKIKDEFLKR